MNNGRETTQRQAEPHPLRGYLYIASAAFLWGISATLGRAAFTGHPLFGISVSDSLNLRTIDPLILSQSRATLSLAILLPALLLQRGASALRVPARDLLRFFLLGVLGVAVSNYFYYLAIQRTNVATAIILQYTAPVWVLIYTAVRLAQRPSLQRVAAVGLAVVGCALAVGFVGSSGFRLDTIGVIAALLAAFSFAFYNVGGHKVLARYDRWKVLLWVLVGTSTFWIFVNPPWKIVAAHYGREQWGFMIVFSLISVLAPFSCYFAGLQHLEPTRAIVASCLEPVFSILIAALLLGELLRPLQTVGIVLVLVAIVLIQWPERTARSTGFVVEPIE
ncbi:MAG TPA: EamA family transporter [Terriglobales bacterium]|nr:EamA family transporter [Terriglobales bacterium]